MLDIAIAARSGLGQRSSNEDSLCHGHAIGGWYAALADGAGGHRRGGEASLRTIRAIESMLHSASESAFSPGILSRIVCGAHAELQRHQVRGDAAAAMHSTVVVLWIDPWAQYALWAHVGDSRLYRVRHGVVDMVTSDDSVVQQMVTAGLITPDQARQHPHKNQLVTALGVEGGIDPHTVVRPVELNDGDAFLLCSDGWWDCVDPTAIAGSLERAVSPDDWLMQMERRIEQRQAPRQDNYSAVALWAGDPQAGLAQAPDDTVPRARR